MKIAQWLRRGRTSVSNETRPRGASACSPGCQPGDAEAARPFRAPPGARACPGHFAPAAVLITGSHPVVFLSLWWRRESDRRTGSAAALRTMENAGTRTGNDGMDDAQISPKGAQAWRPRESRRGASHAPSGDHRRTGATSTKIFPRPWRGAYNGPHIFPRVSPGATRHRPSGANVAQARTSQSLAGVDPRPHPSSANEPQGS